ncbi:hypothetical protein BGZ91_007796, partial [Linnemannia elongata]
MPSSPPPGSSPLSPPSSASSERPEIVIEGHHVLSQLEHSALLGRMSSKSGDVPTITQGLAAIQLGPANLLGPLSHRNAAADDNHEPGDSSDARSVSSSNSSKSGFRKRFSRLFKRDPRVKETVTISAVSSASVKLVRTEGCIQSSAPNSDAVLVSSRRHSPADLVEISSSNLAVPTTQAPGPAADGSIRLDIFSENVAKPTYKTDLPKPHARIDKTPQLVYCCSLLSKSQGLHSSTSDSDASQDLSLDDEEKGWLQLIDP